MRRKKFSIEKGQKRNRMESEGEEDPYEDRFENLELIKWLKESGCTRNEIRNHVQKAWKMIGCIQKVDEEEEEETEMNESGEVETTTWNEVNTIHENVYTQANADVKLESNIESIQHDISKKKIEDEEEIFENKGSDHDLEPITSDQLLGLEYKLKGDEQLKPVKKMKFFHSKYWSKNEDQLLVAAVRAVKNKLRWNDIAVSLPGRCGVKCRARWMNHLCPTVCKDPWSEKEDAILFKTHEVRAFEIIILAISKCFF